MLKQHNQWGEVYALKSLKESSNVAKVVNFKIIKGSTLNLWNTSLTNKK